MKYTFTIDETLSGARLDLAIAKNFENLSRSQIQKCIQDKKVTINDTCITSKKHTVSTEDIITLDYEEKTICEDKPQDMDLEIIYEDNDLLVINKPSGLVVHPGTGVADSTLLNALIARYPENKNLPQAGLIHRLDKDTTGLLIIAKNNPSYLKLNQAMAKRKINRSYTALVVGVVHTSGTINEPLARHPKHRTKFAVSPTGRDALTHYSILERFKHHTLLKVTLETGRTHQIRVHLHYINHPVIGDQMYKKHITPKKNELSDNALNAIYQFKRQALHATTLSFTQPITSELIELSIPLPEDFLKLLNAIRS